MIAVDLVGPIVVEAHDRREWKSSPESAAKFSGTPRGLPFLGRYTFFSRVPTDSSYDTAPFGFITALITY